MNYGDKGEVLYDMVKDPEQYTNVINNPNYAEIIKKARLDLMNRLFALWQNFVEMVIYSTNKINKVRFSFESLLQKLSWKNIS